MLFRTLLVFRADPLPFSIIVFLSESQSDSCVGRVRTPFPCRTAAHGQLFIVGMIGNLDPVNPEIQEYLQRYHSKRSAAA